MKHSTQPDETMLRGIAASPGIIWGPAFIFLQKEIEIPVYSIPENKQHEEVKRLERAIVETRKQIKRVQKKVLKILGEGEARIFDAHLLVLEDKALIEETIKEQARTSLNIEYCFHNVSNRYIEAFSRIDDNYIKERTTDIRDVSRRLLKNLLGRDDFHINRLNEKRIIVSEDFTPSDTASLKKESTLALVTDSGSSTSHAVIMARSLQIPAVVGLNQATSKIENDDLLIIDGYEGLVFIRPTEKRFKEYIKIKEDYEAKQKIFEKVIHLQTQTSDGHSFELYANISNPEETPDVIENGAQGVGLFRTETMFIRRDKFPSENDQYEVYSDIVQALNPLPVTIRTLDLGGDKNINNVLFQEIEQNPFMGFRAIRFCLKHPSIFKEQLRAILRASHFGKVRILYPMISSEHELIQANSMVELCKKELLKNKVPFDDAIEIGAMIEVPSAAYMIDILSKHCSFFSIGTNDLIQYMLAADRTNDRIAHLYKATHPAILRTIHHIIQKSHKANIQVSICGEIGSDPIYTALFIGMGIDSLSLTPNYLSKVKYLIRSISLKEAQKLAKKVLQQDDPEKTFKILRDFYLSKIKNALPNYSP